MKFVAWVTTLSTVLLSASSAAADENVFGWAFEEAAAEPFVALASGAALTALFMPLPEPLWEPSHVAKFDPVPAYISDLIAGPGAFTQVGVGYIFETAALADSGAQYAGVWGLRGAMVETEALLFTAGTTVFLQRLTGHCRPYSRWEGKCKASDGFPSGHTSSISSVAGVRLINVIRSDEVHGVRIASFSLAEVSSILTAYLRVEAGAHSVEDVLVGYALGHALGAAFGLMHPPERATGVPPGIPGDVPSNETMIFNFERRF